MGICLFPLQSLAHWNGEGLLLPLTPRCLRRILKAKVPSAVSLLPMEAGCTQDARASEASRDELQAGGTGWVRAIWVAARQGRGRGCVILLLHWDHPFGERRRGTAGCSRRYKYTIYCNAAPAAEKRGDRGARASRRGHISYWGYCYSVLLEPLLLGRT